MNVITNYISSQDKVVESRVQIVDFKQKILINAWHQTIRISIEGEARV